MRDYRRIYRWFYDNVHSVYYDLLMKWCYLPLGGELKCRNDMISDVVLSGNEKILDMCCGTGGTTFAIAERAPENCDIIGMDMSKGQLERAIKKNNFNNVHFELQDIRRTGADPEIYDKVFISHSLHEMVRKDRYMALREARRILKPNGTLVVLELDRPDSIFLRMFTGLWFFYWLPFNFETPTRRDMLKHGLEHEVKESGFSDVRKIPKCNGILQVVLGLKTKTFN
jgi:demethylmenaquinone methyltransferase/2-methoxy-6-polyprenyl-1,4-benzoquinol methylase